MCVWSRQGLKAKERWFKWNQISNTKAVQLYLLTLYLGSLNVELLIEAAANS